MWIQSIYLAKYVVSFKISIEQTVIRERIHIIDFAITSNRQLQFKWSIDRHWNKAVQSTDDRNFFIIQCPFSLFVLHPQSKYEIIIMIILFDIAAVTRRYKYITFIVCNTIYTIHICNQPQEKKNIFSLWIHMMEMKYVGKCQSHSLSVTMFVRPSEIDVHESKRLLITCIEFFFPFHAPEIYNLFISNEPTRSVCICTQILKFFFRSIRIIILI